MAPSSQLEAPASSEGLRRVAGRRGARAAAVTSLLVLAAASAVLAGDASRGPDMRDSSQR